MRSGRRTWVVAASLLGYLAAIACLLSLSSPSVWTLILAGLAAASFESAHYWDEQPPVSA